MIIFLVGFMGSGKSYVGRNLAPLLGYDYIDLDKYIEEKEGLTVKEIFEQKGEEYFRMLEREYIQHVEPDKNSVISTGGGTPCFFDNMDVMNNKGLTVYLNRSKDMVIHRLLRGQYKRPLLKGLSPEELEKFYDEKLESRRAFYEKATLHAADANVDEILKMIKPFLN
jgi:shikimate kinase